MGNQGVRSRSWYNINLNSESGISFEIVDGNFTDYLESPYGNSTATFDLGSIPVGKYFLKYRATDEYDNISEFDIIQNIEVRDARVPFISFCFKVVGLLLYPRISLMQRTYETQTQVRYWSGM